MTRALTLSVHIGDLLSIRNAEIQPSLSIDNPPPVVTLSDGHTPLPIDQRWRQLPQTGGRGSKDKAWPLNRALKSKYEPGKKARFGTGSYYIY